MGGAFLFCGLLRRGFFACNTEETDAIVALNHNEGNVGNKSIESHDVVSYGWIKEKGER